MAALNLVVDASVFLELSKPTGTRIRPSLGRATLHTPELMLLEVAHVLRGEVLGGRRAPDDARWWLEAIASYPTLTTHSHRELLTRVWGLRASVTAYDASYVALAERLRAPLLTLDRRLARAADSFVEVIVPS